jgi:hypothetical protein
MKAILYKINNYFVTKHAPMLSVIQIKINQTGLIFLHDYISNINILFLILINLLYSVILNVQINVFPVTFPCMRKSFLDNTTISTSLSFSHYFQT